MLFNKFIELGSLKFDSAFEYFSKLYRSGKPLVYFDSARLGDKQGRYSYIAFDPFQIIYSFNQIKEVLQRYHLETIPGLPPFQGGLAGYLSYDLGREFEEFPETAQDDCGYPVLELGLFDIVLSFDHIAKKAWIISAGFPELDAVKRKQRAISRMQECLAYLAVEEDYQQATSTISSDTIKSNFSDSAYQQTVAKVVEFIREGDIFEANLSQRFSAVLPDKFDSLALYKRLRLLNPAPFAAYIKLTDTEILSSSPERFLKLDDRKVETRPIKGTIKRSIDPDQDKMLAQQLLHSEKDRAENTMIVDLMRNDLSRVCKPDSVRVPQHCGLESFEMVHHLVSVVEGELEDDYDAVDLLRATFPGGSITGAPKIRAMEIIEELEPTRRGPYCGSVAYMGFNGAMDSSILIRTYVIKDGIISFQGGGAIVLDSEPLAEYQETLVKINKLHEILVTNDLTA